MSLVVVGLSHTSAPMELLEHIALRPSSITELRAAVIASDEIAESMVLSTCNRVEIVVEADRFHGAVSDIANALAQAGGIAPEGLSEHLYVHYDERAVHHIFATVCGLNSMAQGEPQIVGQVRSALSQAQTDGSVGTRLNPLLQHALRVGKRAHAETDLDSVARSLIERGLDRAAEDLPPLESARVVIIGAGAMAAVSVVAVRNAGADDVVILSRDVAKGEALADRHDVQHAPLADVQRILKRADLVISCTGATTPVVTSAMVFESRVGSPDARPLAFIDLSLPADVEPSVAAMSGVSRLGLADLQALKSDGGVSPHAAQVLAEVSELVTSEVAAYTVSQRGASVAPTVAAVRARAGAVVSAEMDRLARRLPHLDDKARQEVANAMSRVVDKLLHTPTVRAKELQHLDAPHDYAAVLHELFNLDPRDTLNVNAPPPISTGDFR